MPLTTLGKKKPQISDKVGVHQSPKNSTQPLHGAVTKNGHYNPQYGCTLLSRLPLEIRSMIYEEVMELWSQGHRVHILRAPRLGEGPRLIHAPCLACEEDVENPKPDNSGLLPTWAKVHASCTWWMPPKRWGLISLLLTCHQM